MCVRRIHLSPSGALALVLAGWAAVDAGRWAAESFRRPAENSLPALLIPDVNRAPARHLLLLPGIGPVRARAIVEERVRAGPFARLADLERVRGIGPRTVLGLRRRATASDP